MINRPCARKGLFQALWMAVAFLVCGFLPKVFAAEFRTFTFTDQVITNTAAGISDEVVVDSFGSTIAFVSTANISSGNPEGNPEIFVVHLYFNASAVPIQVTRTPAGVINAHPNLNADGSLLIFQSTGNLDSAVGNADGGPETFSADLASPTIVIRQLTIDQQGIADLSSPNPDTRVSSADSNVDGLLVVFASRSSQMADTNNADQNSEIFIYDRLEDIYYQVTNTPAAVNNLHPTIDDEGTTVAYLTNIDGNYEVHVANIIEEPIEVDPCVEDPTLCESNLLPVITHTPAGNQTVDENQTLSMSITVSDPDGDNVALRVSQADGSAVPAGLQVVLDPSVCDPDYDDCTCNPAVYYCYLPSDLVANLTWRPSSTQGGRDYQFIFRAVDDYDLNAEVSELMTVTVNNVNQAPAGLLANLGTRTVKVGQVMQAITYSANDGDCDTLTATATMPSGAQFTTPTFTPCPATPVTGSTSRISGQITWTPQPGQEGTYPVTVTVTDGALTLSGTATITVVTNRPPVVTNSVASAYERGCFMLKVQGSDPDGDPLVYDVVLSTLPPGATFDRGQAMIHWHPDTSVASPNNPARFTITVSASDLVASVSKDVVLTVFDSPDDQAVFVSVPSSITAAPGSLVSISAVVRNTGYSTWSSTYFVETDYSSTGLTVPAPVLITGTLVPGDIRTVVIPVRLPTVAGNYSIRFRTANNGQRFGISSGTVTLRAQ